MKFSDLNNIANKQSHSVKAFSLVEMLVVLTVVGILMAFAAPNVFSLVQARTLSNEGSVLRNQLTYAQQIAVSKNADVEIRFFKWAPEPDLPDLFGAFQLFQYNNLGEMEPISTFFRIRGPAAVSLTHSTLLIPGNSDASDAKYGFISPHQKTYPDTPVGEGGQKIEAEYVAFRFRPDGSTDLPNRSGNDTWYITLVQGEGAAISDALPRNYVCLQINPYNGVVSEFRP